MPAPTPPPSPSPGPPEITPWRPVSARQRLWLLLLTLATVLGLAYVLQRPHQQLVADKAARHRALCAAVVASRPADCPGARMPVLLLPPPAASAAAATAPR